MIGVFSIQTISGLSCYLMTRMLSLFIIYPHLTSFLFLEYPILQLENFFVLPRRERKFVPRDSKKVQKLLDVGLGLFQSLSV